MVADNILRLLMINVNAEAEDGFNTLTNPRLNVLDAIILDIIVLNVMLGCLMTEKRESNRILLKRRKWKLC
jgi:hypothetical protein